MDDQVTGYVKAVGPGGMFVTLSRDLDGRAKLSNLAQGFLEEPSKEFPAGKLVRARVLSLAGGRFRVSR